MELFILLQTSQNWLYKHVVILARTNSRTLKETPERSLKLEIWKINRKKHRSGSGTPAKVTRARGRATKDWNKIMCWWKMHVLLAVMLNMLNIIMFAHMLDHGKIATGRSSWMGVVRFSAQKHSCRWKHDCTLHCFCFLLQLWHLKSYDWQFARHPQMVESKLQTCQISGQLCDESCVAEVQRSHWPMFFRIAGFASVQRAWLPSFRSCSWFWRIPNTSQSLKCLISAWNSVASILDFEFLRNFPSFCKTRPKDIAASVLIFTPKERRFDGQLWHRQDPWIHDHLLLRGWRRVVLLEWPCMQGACKAIRKLEVGETLQSLEDFRHVLSLLEIVELPPLCVLCLHLCKFIQSKRAFHWWYHHCLPRSPDKMRVEAWLESRQDVVEVIVTIHGWGIPNALMERNFTVNLGSWHQLTELISHGTRWYNIHVKEARTSFDSSYVTRSKLSQMAWNLIIPHWLNLT